MPEVAAGATLAEEKDCAEMTDGDGEAMPALEPITHASRGGGRFRGITRGGRGRQSRARSAFVWRLPECAVGSTFVVAGLEWSRVATEQAACGHAKCEKIFGKYTLTTQHLEAHASWHHNADQAQAARLAKDSQSFVPWQDILTAQLNCGQLSNARLALFIPSSTLLLQPRQGPILT